jgi:hypothetical protein
MGIVMPGATSMVGWMTLVGVVGCTGFSGGGGGAGTPA